WRFRARLVFLCFVPWKDVIRLQSTLVEDGFDFRRWMERLVWRCVRSALVWLIQTVAVKDHSLLFPAFGRQSSEFTAGQIFLIEKRPDQQHRRVLDIVRHNPANR